MCALVFVDSFDHYATAHIPTKWPLAVGSVEIQSGGGRRGTNSLRCLGDTDYVARLFPPAATWIVGMAVRFASNITSATCQLVDWSDGGTVQARVCVTVTGQVQLQRGDGTILATSTLGLGFETTYYLEWWLTVSATAGVSTVRIDGIPVVSVSGAPTQVSGAAVANRLRVGNLQVAAALGNLDIDDLYVCNTAGSINSGFLGDCRVDYLPPEGDGTHRAWTPSAGTDHYATVDDLTPNADTDYLASSTAGARDTQTFPTLPAMPNPVVRGVQHCAMARKDDAGTRVLKSLLLSGATTQVGATAYAMALTYVCYTELYETDPNTGAAWTPAAVNALEAGLENQ